MALDKQFFDSIDIELVKRKFYNANKVNSLLTEIKARAQSMEEEILRLKTELEALQSQKAEISEAVLTAKKLSREMTEKAEKEAAELLENARREAEETLSSARAEAETLVSQATERRDEIISEKQQLQDRTVEKVQSCFDRLRQQHLEAVETLNAQWQDFLVSLYDGEETCAEVESAQLPEDFSEKLGELAQQLDDIDNMENTEN